MKTYKIYLYQTDEEVGEIRAVSVDIAELKYALTNDKYGSDEFYALSVPEDEEE